ncbi:MAG: ABC transporter permease [Gemmatimonadota bacterium]|nr:ABC transporter permease [Gemmatimonadota bacterium]
MKRARLIRSAAASLKTHRLRTFFMTLGTLIGVTALTVVMAYGRGTQDAVLDNFNRMFGGSTIMLMSGGGTMGGPHAAAGPTTTLKLGDLTALGDEIPEIIASDPMQLLGEFDVVYDGSSSAVMVSGHSDSQEIVWNRGVSSGTYFGRDDVDRSARVAVVGEKLVDEVFGGRDPLGESVRIGNVPFEVIGVLDPMGVDPHGVDLDREIHVPITTAMRRLTNVDYITSAKISVRESADLDAVVLSITDVLRPRHALGDREPNDFQMITPVQVEGMIESGNRVFTLFLPIVAAISILIGGVVVANLMLMSVNERRAEIGLRKAVGAKSRDISTQFLFESAAVTALGGLLALGLGYAVLRAMGGASTIARSMGDAETEEAARVALGLPWDVALLGIGTAVAVGLLAGVLPARRAAALDPVETLR